MLTNILAKERRFMDQFNGCPILKFQIVNEFSNREGSELVDCIMKVIGIKFKGHLGRVTHSQYVRVNLVDFEHPFLSRVWHGVHILDATSPLLTDKARQRIKENNGSWPSNWFNPDVIRSKLDFHDLIVTVAGLSNVSAVTVHAYKRYKVGDVLIGFNFAPIVFRNVETGLLEVDLALANDVREQSGLGGENLSIRRNNSKEYEGENLLKPSSSIHITKSKSGDALGNENDLNRTGNSAGKNIWRSNPTTILRSESDVQSISAFMNSSYASSRLDTNEADDLPDLPVIARNLDNTGSCEHGFEREG
jgi:hypothetical protein